MAIAIACALFAFGLIAATVALRRPSHERSWAEDLRVLSGIEPHDDGSVLLTHVRDWRYARGSVVSKNYFAWRYEPDDLQRIWLYEQKLGLGGAIAHTFVVLEFPATYGSARWLGLSVEARREVGETYSPLAGMLRTFEVTHVWATEEDLVTRRVALFDYPLARYEVKVPEEHLAPIFMGFVEETAALAEAPQWYNTFTTNCTSALVRYVNRVQPGAIPWHYSFVLTGWVDDHLARLGYLSKESAQPITREWLAENRLR